MILLIAKLLCILCVINSLVTVWLLFLHFLDTVDWLTRYTENVTISNINIGNCPFVENVMETFSLLLTNFVFRIRIMISHIQANIALPVC